MAERPSVIIPPPLPLYSFPAQASVTRQQPPRTGFANTLPWIRHTNRSESLREPLQDPRRCVALGEWFAARDREECCRRLVYDTADPTGASLDRRSDDVVFDSRFESGNLRAAWRVEGRRGTGGKGDTISRPGEPSYVDHEYDLVCNNDTNTNGHVQWFYFSVEAEQPLRIRLNIVNMMKKTSLYSLGMLPVAFCENASHEYGWTRAGEDVCYFRNARNTCADRRGETTYAQSSSTRSYSTAGNNGASSSSSSSSRQSYYTLSFVIAAPAKNRVFLAHCYPYTYSDLRQDLGDLEKRVGPSILRRRKLCTTLAGNDCDLLTVTNFETRDPEVVRRRPGVVFTARVHPGESNSSFVMRGCLEFLTSENESARLLRDNFVFKIVPMLNPDGVINGNYRSSLAGEDLNRRYVNPSASLQPTVHAVKQLLRATHESRGVLLYVDMHGHSRKKNVFFYGCSEPSMAPSSTLKEEFSAEHCVMARVLPKIAAQLNDDNSLEPTSGQPEPGTRRKKLFSFRDSSFGVQQAKRETGRVVAWRELAIANSFTLEASFCSPGFNEEHDLLLQNESSTDVFFKKEPASALVSGRADVCSHPVVIEEPEEEVESSLNAENSADSRTQIREKCARSWACETHYTIKDFEEAGRQLCLALYHYAELDHHRRRYQSAAETRKVEESTTPSALQQCSRPRCGELVVPKIFHERQGPLLEYGVYHVDVARKAISATNERVAPARRARAELELRASLRAQAATNGYGPSPSDYEHARLDQGEEDDAILSEGDSDDDASNTTPQRERKRIEKNKKGPTNAEEEEEDDDEDDYSEGSNSDDNHSVDQGAVPSRRRRSKNISACRSQRNSLSIQQRRRSRKNSPRENGLLSVRARSCRIQRQRRKSSGENSLPPLSTILTRWQSYGRSSRSEEARRQHSKVLKRAITTAPSTAAGEGRLRRKGGESVEAASSLAAFYLAKGGKCGTPPILLSRKNTVHGQGTKVSAAAAVPSRPAKRHSASYITTNSSSSPSRRSLSLQRPTVVRIDVCDPATISGENSFPRISSFQR